MFGGADRVNEAAAEFARLSGIGSTIATQFQIEQIGRNAGTSSSEVIVVGIEFLRNLDRFAHGQNHTEETVQAAIDTTADRIANGELRFLGRRNTPIAKTLQPAQAGAIVREIARKYRPVAFSAYYLETPVPEGLDTLRTSSPSGAAGHIEGADGRRIECRLFVDGLREHVAVIADGEESIKIPLNWIARAAPINTSDQEIVFDLEFGEWAHFVVHPPVGDEWHQLAALLPTLPPADDVVAAASVDAQEAWKHIPMEGHISLGDLVSRSWLGWGVIDGLRELENQGLIQKDNSRNYLRRL